MSYVFGGNQGGNLGIQLSKNLYISGVMMNKKKNYVLESFKYVQCIIGKVMIKTALIHKVELVQSEIKELRIKDSECPNAKITKSNFKNSMWKGVNLSDAHMENCKIGGLRINGYLISELIEERESILASKR